MYTITPPQTNTIGTHRYVKLDNDIYGVIYTPRHNPTGGIQAIATHAGEDLYVGTFPNWENAAMAILYYYDMA